MKEIKIKKGSFVTSKKKLRRSFYGESRRVIGESEFWKRTALQQQVIIHAKNRT